jgi:hypothetical protein
MHEIPMMAAAARERAVRRDMAFAFLGGSANRKLEVFSFHFDWENLDRFQSSRVALADAPFCLPSDQNCSRLLTN